MSKSVWKGNYKHMFHICFMMIPAKSSVKNSERTRPALDLHLRLWSQRCSRGTESMRIVLEYAARLKDFSAT